MKFNRFLEATLGSIVGFGISLGLFLLVIILIIGASVASLSIKSSTTVKVEDNSILVLDLSGTITDRAEPIDPFRQLYSSGDETNTIALNDIVAAIKSAADDDRIQGILIDCNGTSMGMAQAQAIINAISEFKTSNAEANQSKPVYAYSDNYSQLEYFIACAADSIFLNPVGEADIHGLESTTLFFKDFLDKIGVEMQVVKVGTYKSAVEPFLLNNISEANKEQQQHYLGSLWSVISNQIAEARGVTVDIVNKWADAFSYTQPAEWFTKEKIVDRLLYRHELTDMLKDLTGKKKLRTIDCADYATTLDDKKGGKHSDKIVVLYAVGDISDKGDKGITSEKLVPEILEIAEDDDVAGLILRVNSGGGSAFASEQIWEALQQYKKITGKPFYVSMGDVAASGGYYISCGADKIYADPLTITGSIGIFGMIPSAQKLLTDKLGINQATVTTNADTYPTLFKNMSASQRQAFQRSVDRGYELFVKRCADGRNLPVDSIKAIAEGRVWDGVTAQKIGLVDKLGGLDAAICDMAKELNSSNYYIEELPEIETKWWDVLFSFGSDMKAKMIQKELGDAAKYYNAINTIGNMNPLQCRIDFIEIK